MPPSAALPQVSETGVVEARYWDNIRGGSVSALTNLSAYPDEPDQVMELGELRGPENRADRYGSLVRGFIVPPADGSYRFFATGDGETQFWLSTDQNPENISMIALVPGSTRPGDYNRYNSQSSGTIDLTEGDRYYFEIRHKENSGGDHFAVAWEGPGFSRRVIGGDSIASLGQAQEGTALSEEAEAAYSQGYRTGYSHGSEGLDFDGESSSRAQAAGEEVQGAYSLGYRIGYFDGPRDFGFDSGFPPLDQDQDSIYDNWETAHGLDPDDPSDATSDSDQDLLNAQDEFWLGTSPASADTDGDGIPDGVEFAYGLSPLDPEDAQEDRDGDGTSNVREYHAGTRIDDSSGFRPSLPVQEESVTSDRSEVTVSWTAPLTRMDGTSIALSEIERYEVLYGQHIARLDDTVTVDGAETSTTISGLTPGTWLFAIRVIDDNGLASPLSDTVEYRVD